MRRLVVGNWKMHETAAQAGELARVIVASLDGAQLHERDVEVVLAPPFTALAAVRAAARESAVALGAQNMHWANAGAFTGEIAPPMLVELGVRYVIVGHSERRRYFGETDADVNRKVRAALEHGLTPVVAVGETSEERASGATDERVSAQTRAALEGIAPERLHDIAIAYEPIWAIGTAKSCEPGEAARVMALIRGSVAGLEHTPLLYGGSVTPANFAAYLATQHCRGGLVGGASLDAAAFAALVRLACDKAA
ncbi:MAG TPA: triose-phosphate isomerase [Candidatus Dormibacteraeota bacterium]|nr:triose-phosphate isomerase [Candidatus Dormibacteraeota bacterium]